MEKYVAVIFSTFVLECYTNLLSIRSWIINKKLSIWNPPTQKDNWLADNHRNIKRRHSNFILGGYRKKLITCILLQLVEIIWICDKCIMEENNLHYIPMKYNIINVQLHGEGRLIEIVIRRYDRRDWILLFCVQYVGLSLKLNENMIYVNKFQFKIGHPIYFIFFKQGSTAVPRNAYPNISQSVSATIKGPQRMMSSPAASNIGAPYRGTNWTQHGYSNAQQAYRYTSPQLPQPAYTTYAASQQATPVSRFFLLKLSNEAIGKCKRNLSSNRILFQPNHIVAWILANLKHKRNRICVKSALCYNMMQF